MNWITNYVRPKINSMLGRRDMPENLWIKDPETGEMVFHKDLESNQFVIPSSGHHMKISAKERLRYFFDNGKYELIENPKAAVDPRAAGFNVCVIVMMKLSAKTRQAAEKFTAAIAKVKAVSECHSLSGRYDYLCKVYARDVAEFESLVMSDLSQLPGLMDMESFFILSSPVDARGVPV